MSSLAYSIFKCITDFIAGVLGAAKHTGLWLIMWKMDDVITRCSIQYLLNFMRSECVKLKPLNG